MTFLHTIFLTALAASTIPILLHILSRQRLPLIKFSSLEFLLKLQKRKARRIKIRQLILLAIRTLAVIAVVLVFARPALQSSGSSSSAASVEIVIVLDNGIASLAESKDGQLFRLAKEYARELIELADAGDYITLIPAAQPQLTAGVPAGQRDLIYDRLDRVEPCFYPPDLERSLTLADSILSNSQLFNRELYLVSPFYGEDWDSLRWEPFSEAVRGYIIVFGPERLDNLSVSEVNIQSSIFQRGEPVEIEAVFENHAGRSVQDALVSVYLAGDRVAQASVDIPKGGATRRSFTLMPERSGLMAGSVRCEEIDPLTADSRRHFILDIPDSISVFVVAPDTVDRMVLAAALAGGKTGFIKLHWGDPVGWETASLAGYDVLILAGVGNVHAGASERIGEFIERGGGVIIFQGPNSDLAVLSRGLWRRLGFAGAAEFVKSGGIGWGKLDLEHPLFQGIFEEKGSPRSPSFELVIDLVKAKGDQVIIPLANGKPMLIERQVGSGRALMFAVTLGPSGGDFAYTGIFAPLVFSAINYAASASANSSYGWETGRSPRVLLPLPRAETARLELPNGDFIELPPRPVVGGVEFNVPIVSLPGIYTLKINRQNVARFAANLPVNQSSLRRTDLDGLGERMNGAAIITAEDKDLAETVYSFRFGRELWQPIAAVFLVLLFAESMIGKAWKREENVA